MELSENRNSVVQWSYCWSVSKLYSYTDKTYLYVGDVIPIATTVPDSWIWAYDTNPLAAREEKKILLDETASKHQVLFFEHDAYNECCTIEAQYNKHRVGKTFRLEEIGKELK